MSEVSIPLSWPLIIAIASTFCFGVLAGYEAIKAISAFGGRRWRDVSSTVAIARRRMDDIDEQIRKLASRVVETREPSGADIAVLRSALDVRRSAVRDVLRLIVSK